MVANTVSMPVDPLLGATVHGYVIQSRVGEGGMGIVYRGEQTDIGKRVAIKVLKPGLTEQADLLQRLVAEARAVNAIRHRGIVDIFGYAKLPDGRQCILMEFLEGETLDQIIRTLANDNRTLPLADTLRISDEVLQAIAAAHRAGVVHRDLKPSNIFLCRQSDGERHVKLVDFGVAKMITFEESRASAVLGTPLYMAPEQAQGDTVTPAIDLYAFGVILFEMLTGRPPFHGETAVRVIYHHLQTEPPRPSGIVPSLPGALDHTVLRLLAKKPSSRHADAEEVRRELSRVKVALADPSALQTPDAPSAPFSAREPLEQTFMSARLPPAPPGRSWTVPFAIAAGVAALGVTAVWRATHTREAAPAPEVTLAPPPPPAPAPKEPLTAEVVAPPEPALKPVPAARPDPLKGRLDALEKKLKKLEAQGDDVELFRRQLVQLRSKLQASPDEGTREQLELALSRLEEELR